jgi:GxxExxY protein
METIGRKQWTENEVSGLVLDICIQLHRKYGPGLFERVYEELLWYELKKRELFVERQKPVPLIHDGIRLEMGFRADLIIENKVILELKSVKELADVHFRQVLTYIKLTGIKLGLLINFNESVIKEGFHRVVNGL